MRAVASRVASRNIRSRNSRFISCPTSKRSDIGIAAVSISVLAAHRFLEESSSSKTTHLQSHPATTTTTTLLDENAKIGEEVFLGYLTKPLGIGTYLRQTLLEWQQQHRDELDEIKPVEEVQQEAQKPEARFPSLQAKLLSSQQGDRENFIISANEPITIDNELFVGKVILVLRPLSPEDDPDFEHRMNGEDTNFHIQFQGKFKRPVRKDRLYVGAQLASNNMNLSNLARRASDFLLMLLSKNMGSNMKYSFGSDTELPHISFPLHTGMQRVVKSSATDALPPIGTPFVESEESKSRRQSDDFQGWDTDMVYSMSYSANSINLPAWKVLLPFEMNLSRFWGDSAMRLVIYEDGGDDSHEKAYLFNLQMEHVQA